MILKESLKDAVNGMCITIQLILSALLFFENSPVFWTFLIDILFLYGILKSPMALMITNSVTFMLLVLVIIFLTYFTSSLLDRFREYLRNQDFWEVWK